MGVNIIGATKLRRLRRVAEDPLIDHAWTQSHHCSGRYVHFVTSDHRHGVWDRDDDDVEWLTGDDVNHWSSCARFTAAPEHHPI